MKVLNDYSLKALNTFRIDVKAKYFVDVRSIEELREVLQKFSDEKVYVLGEGANILLTQDLNCLVIKNSIKGITKYKEDEDFVYFKVGAGESWHEFVMYTVGEGLGGVENMVFIPGTVGAAPVQNIAAYGQNFSDVFEELSAIEIETRKEKIFTKAECDFGYRTSLFKYQAAGKYIIVNVSIKLAKNPKINTSYFETGKTYAKNVSLADELNSISSPTVKDVALAVMKIRKNKLPDINEVGTAGSVFKNPVITRSKYEELKKDDPDLQPYPVDNLSYAKEVNEEKVKIPAGRLLDNLGWKGKRIGDVGTHPTQALAVVNYGNASPSEILAFMEEMKKSVKTSYGIELEEEILII